jgi:hypothetical protein
MQAIADEAHKLGRKVAAHAHGTKSVKHAIRAGIDSIEHSSLIDEEGIALAKSQFARKGRCADLIAVRGDALSDVKTLQGVSLS